MSGSQNDRVFENLLRHVRLLGRESARKVRLRLALTLKELGLNLMNQYCAAPAVLNGGVSVPFALGTGSHTQNLNIVSPGQFGNKLSS
jgi:hypothetical protein